MDEHAIITALDAAIWPALRAGKLDLPIRRVTATLARDPRARLAWEAVPLDAYGPLPDTIRSTWIFALRGGTSTGAERHPNSIQRVMAYRGRADLQTRQDGAWRTNMLDAAPGSPLSRRWLSIPVNAWHRPVIPAGADWLVISFHTATAEDLIEERAADDEQPDAATAGREVYAGRIGR